MKDGYRYVNGKVFVTDYSNGNEREIEIRHYQDNIEEILITENILEKLNSEYIKVNEIYKEGTKKLDYLKSTMRDAFMCVFLMTFLFGGLISLLLSSWISLFLFFIVLLGIFYKVIIKHVMENIKELRNKLKGYKLTIGVIEKEKEKQMGKLKELKENITRKKIDNNSENIIQSGEYIQLDYVGKLKELREYLCSCYAVGYLYDCLPNDIVDFVNNNTSELNTDFINMKKVRVLKKKFNDIMKDR